MFAEPWVVVDAVARRLGIACGTVYQWIGGQRRPARPVGRRWTFKRSGVQGRLPVGGAREPNLGTP